MYRDRCSEINSLFGKMGYKKKDEIYIPDRPRKLREFIQKPLPVNSYFIVVSTDNDFCQTGIGLLPTDNLCEKGLSSEMLEEYDDVLNSNVGSVYTKDNDIILKCNNVDVDKLADLAMEFIMR